MGDDHGTPFDKSKSHPAALTTNKYGVGKMELLKACTSREILLMKRNTFVYIFKSAQLFIVALITMTLFLRTEMHRESVNDGSIYSGAFFFTISTIMFNGMAEMSMTIAKLPFFRGIAAVSRSLIVASTFGSFALLILFALGGFVLSRVNVKQWWIWGYWVSPMMYGMNAIAVNEFLGHQWNHVLPNTTEPLGVTILKSRGFFQHAYWYWIGVGALLAFVMFFNFCFALALSFLKPIGKPQAVIPAEDYKGSTKEGIDQKSFKDRGDHITRNSPRFSSTRTEDNVEVHNRRKGMVLTFEPHSITFDEIKYSVDMPQEMKEQGIGVDKLMLLKGVSGAFRPCVLTALMGVSDAGKTTLMDVLAGRKTGGYIEGHSTISGYPKKQETFARISGYCEQNDIHSPHVTVYESLIYSAWLLTAYRS